MLHNLDEVEIERRTLDRVSIMKRMASRPTSSIIAQRDEIARAF